MQSGGRADLISAHMETGAWRQNFGAALVPLGQIYRGADNPYIDRLFRQARHHQNVKLVPKGRGAIDMLRSMREGTHFGAMMDQKLNEGSLFPFWSRCDDGNRTD